MNLNKIAGESFHGLQVADIANLGEDSVNAFVSHSTLSLVMLNATP